MGEFDFIAALRQQLAPGVFPPNRRLLVPPGDDTAELKLTATGGLLFAADLLMDGVHFKLKEVGGALAGRKSLAVNLSDVAAMAGTPMAVTVSLALPRQGGQSLAADVMSGILHLAREHDVAIAGGDTNSWDGPLVISVAIVGTPHRRGSVTRGGARAGDHILVTGRLGGSLGGRHLSFKPRVKEAQVLRDRYAISAMIDLSDGLASDLRHLLTESRCQSAVLRRDDVPIHADATAAGTNDKSPLERALTDGEDFELCFTAPEGEAARLVRDQPFGDAVPLTAIGKVESGNGKDVDLKWQGGDAIAWRGYTHDLR